MLSLPLKDPRGEIRRALNSAKMRCAAAGKPFHLSQQVLEEMLRKPETSGARSAACLLNRADTTDAICGRSASASIR